jgi:hypothetical protein
VKLENHFIHITPHPILSWFEGSNDGVLGGMEVLGGMLVFGGVAASDMATGHTEPEMEPVVTDFETVFATRGARLDVFNLLDVGASGHSKSLRSSLLV